MKRNSAATGLRFIFAGTCASVLTFGFCLGEEGAPPALPSDLPGLPAAVLSPQGVAVRQAEVKIEYAEWDKLKAGASCYGDNNKYQWADIPAGLDGVRWSKHPMHAATLQFTVKEPGLVFMAVTTRFAKSGKAGDWQKDLIDSQGLEKKGWHRLTQFDHLRSTDVGWVVYYRECGAGETHSYRTEKYVAPIILMR